ncbi:hypothetical protein [Vibrio sp. R78045]|uniref:hypothetical protein n=1 Tax=Vibrio sp. R78045 TaxID=3093868 RepID=UPI0036F3EACA
MMKCRRVKQMMVDVANASTHIRGYKTAKEKGVHGFDQAGVFHCSGSNFIWVYEGCTVSLPGVVRDYIEK